MTKKFFCDVVVKDLETNEFKFIHQFIHSNKYRSLSKKINGINVLYNVDKINTTDHKNKNKRIMKEIIFIRNKNMDWETKYEDIQNTNEYEKALWAVSKLKRMEFQKFKIVGYHAYMIKNEKLTMIDKRESEEISKPKSIIFRPYKYSNIEKMPNIFKIYKEWDFCGVNRI